MSRRKNKKERQTKNWTDYQTFLLLIVLTILIKIINQFAKKQKENFYSKNTF